MFEFIKNAFDYLHGILDSFIEFFKGFVSGLTKLFQLFPKILQLVSRAISSVPDLFVVFITITVAITIIYIIVGRNVGDSS